VGKKFFIRDKGIFTRDRNCAVSCPLVTQSDQHNCLLLARELVIQGKAGPVTAAQPATQKKNSLNLKAAT